MYNGESVCLNTASSAYLVVDRIGAIIIGCIGNGDYITILELEYSITTNPNVACVRRVGV
jgi:hypothetical protein